MNQSQANELYAAVADLVQMFIDGSHYDHRNPYSRPQVKRALKAMAAINGTKDWMDACKPLPSPRTYTDDEMRTIGNNIAEVLYMRHAVGTNYRDIDGSIGWQCVWGWKTGKGVFQTILRIAEDINNNEAHSDLTKGL